MSANTMVNVAPRNTARTLNAHRLVRNAAKELSAVVYRIIGRFVSARKATLEVRIPNADQNATVIAIAHLDVQLVSTAFARILARDHVELVRTVI